MASDPIVGEWRTVQNVTVYSNGTVLTESFPQCENFIPSSQVFLDEAYNHLYTKNYYMSINENEPQCFSEIGGGSWTKITEGAYSATMEQFVGSDVPYNGIETIFYEASFPVIDTLYLRNLNKLELLQQEDATIEDFYQILFLKNRWL